MGRTSIARGLVVSGLAVAVVGMTGCYATKKSVREEFARVRSEMTTADQQITTQLNDATTRLNGRIDALEQNVQKMQTELSDLNVKVTRLNGLIAFDVPVHFEFDKADLREADQAVLKRFAAVVKEFYPGAVLTAEGFTDRAGSPGYNLRLGQRRANAVRDYLTTEAGIDANNIRTVSYGESTGRLINTEFGPGDTGMQNRRVVIVLDYVGTAVGIAPPVTTN